MNTQEKPETLAEIMERLGELNSYDLQSKKFIELTGIKIKSKFKGLKFHFDDDKECRHVYEVTFTGYNRPSFKITYGDSIANSRLGSDAPMPRNYDILTCITKNDPYDFKNFCSDFGYEEDSIKALKTYKAVKREWQKVSAFFSAKELEALNFIQ